MTPVTAPATDVNSETVQVVHWYVEDGARVEEAEIIVHVETSKSVLDVPAGCNGIVQRLAAEGDDVPLDEPLAYVFENEEARRAFVEQRRAAVARAEAEGPRATAKARELAARHGIDLADVAAERGPGLITHKHVEAILEQAAQPAAPTLRQLPEPLDVAGDEQRILLIGAGGAAAQTLDILLHDAEQAPVALVSEVAEDWGREVSGIPVVGGVERIQTLHADRRFDRAIVAITDVAARARLRQLLVSLEIPLANAIDPTVKICSDVQMGTGNIVCAFCHFGTGTVVGDGNFISAYNSFDHHNRIGNDISTGPGCFMSGTVTVEDRVRLATGIFVEPHLTIGADALVASGSVLTRSVPPDHVVKARAGQVAMVPRGGSR